MMLMNFSTGSTGFPIMQASFSMPCSRESPRKRLPPLSLVSSVPDISPVHGIHMKIRGYNNQCIQQTTPKGAWRSLTMCVCVPIM